MLSDKVSLHRLSPVLLIFWVLQYSRHYTAGSSQWLTPEDGWCLVPPLDPRSDIYCLSLFPCFHLSRQQGPPSGLEGHVLLNWMLRQFIHTKHHIKQLPTQCFISWCPVWTSCRRDLMSSWPKGFGFCFYCLQCPTQCQFRLFNVQNTVWSLLFTQCPEIWLDVTWSPLRGSQLKLL